jgi:hypothetical protein
VNLSNRDAKFWLVAGAVVAFVVLVIGWEFVISPERDSAASLRSQAANSQVQNANTAAQVAKLAKLNQNQGQLVAQLHDALAGLPSDTGLPTFTQQVNAQARANHVTLSSVAVGGITAPVAPPVGTDPTAGTDPSASTDASTSDSTDTTTDGSGATTTDAAPTGGLPANTVSIPFTFITNGSATDQLAFLHDLRVNGPRRALVTATSFAVPSTTGTVSIDSSCTMTVQLTVFAAVRSSAERAEFAKLLQG